MTVADAGGVAHVHREKVRFHSCDHAGHTNNVAAWAFLEAAREEFLYEVGMLKPTADAASLNFTTARVWMEYLSETFFGDVLEIRTTVARLGNKSFELAHDMVRSSDGELVARGGCVLVCFDYVEKRTIPLSDEYRTALSRYQRPRDEE